MKIMIVGAQGMLGTDLAKALSQRHEICAPSLEEFDITSAEQCRRWVGSSGAHAVICAAALTDVDYCETHEVEAFRVNAEGVANLAGACAAARCILVHYSTDYVFDGRKQAAYVEEDPPIPLGVYGRSKLRGEELLKATVPEFLILRISWLFGRNGKNFIRTILNAARTSRLLRVVNDQWGSPTYTRDVAGHTEMLLESGCRGIYHLTNSGSCTWFELAQRAVEWAGIHRVSVIPVTTAEFPRPAPRPANSVLANARLEREGLPIMRPWADAVRAYLNEI